MGDYDNLQARSQRSFRRAQAHYENDSGADSGVDEFTCVFCGEHFNIPWFKEYGCSEYGREPYCPSCGWDNDPESGQEYTHQPEEDMVAPCPVCNLMVHPVGWTGRMDEVTCLSCGHWIIQGMDDNWDDYRAFYEMGDYEEAKRIARSFLLGLSSRSEFKHFTSKTPKAAECERYEEL
jgi:hypothetical protein